MNRLVESMPDRIIQVIAANGAKTQHLWNSGNDD
jgi:hypothetical protein